MSEELHNLLPAPLRRDANYKALSDLLDRCSALDLTKLLVYWFDIVDASALPLLAQQFHIMGLEGWDFATTESEKRALLKQAVELHRYKGTPWAVRQGIRRYDPNIDIEEWQEYGGRPFYFRLTGQSVTLTLGQAVKMIHTIEALKSLRSKLDGGIEAEESTRHETCFRYASRIHISMEDSHQRQGATARQASGDVVQLTTITRCEVIL